MGQGAVLQQGHVPATERPGWSWLTGTERPGKGWWRQGWRVAVESTQVPAAKGSHTFTGITCETLLFPARFSSCVMVPGARHPLPEVGGEAGCKNTGTGQMWLLPKSSVTRKGEQGQQWNGDVSPWHGTHVLAPRTRRHLVVPCTAWLQQSPSSVSPETPLQECLESEPEGFSSSLWVQLHMVMISFLAPWAIMWQQDWASEPQPKLLSAQKWRGSWKVKMEINLWW